MVSGSLPGGCDRRSQIGRQGSAFDELLPRGSHFSLVHFGTSNVTKARYPRQSDLAINHPLRIASRGGRHYRAKRNLNLSEPFERESSIGSEVVHALSL